MVLIEILVFLEGQVAELANQQALLMDIWRLAITVVVKESCTRLSISMDLNSESSSNAGIVEVEES